MKPDYSKELDPVVREKMKKNLVYVSIFSIVMLFAGFTSGYIVSMGDVFWLKYPLPLGFWISTTFIALSSIFYIIAIKGAKKRNLGQVKVFMIATLLSGIGFAVFQILGYGQLIDEGANFRNSIMVTDGRYGDYFEIKYKGQFIEVDANDYLIKGKVLSEGQMNELKSFVKNFENTDKPSGYNIPSLSSNFVLYFKNEPLTLQNGKLMKPNGEVIQYLDMKRLKFLAWNIRDGRGDFFHKGKLGKDFHIYYKGKELSYKNRSLMFGNKILSAPLQNKINQSRDTSTSYLYLITVLHFLHIFGALIYLMKMVKISFSSSFDDKNELSLRLGAIFWHFLGLLWLYLLLFFLFIH
jgi:cytochrome c oxidase subunit III